MFKPEIPNYPRQIYRDNYDYFIKFRCGICGRRTRASGRVEKCGICQAPLCHRCNRYGFCVKDYNILMPEDQAWARATSLKKWVGSTFVFVSLLLFFISFEVIRANTPLTSEFNHMYPDLDYLITFGIFLGGMVVGLICMHFLINHAEDVKQGIGRAYSKEKNNSMLNATPMEKTSEPLFDAQVERRCPQCGIKVSSSDTFCPSCGVDLV